MGSSNKPRQRRKKPIRIVIGTAAILCVGITLFYHHRAQPSFKRAALYTPGTVVVTAIDGAPSQGASSQSRYVPRSEAALPSGTSPLLSAFSSDLSLAREETTSDLAAREDLGVGDVGDLPAGDELSAAKASPLNPLADRQREEEVTLDKEPVEETGEVDYEDDGQEEVGDGEQLNEEEESGEVMEEEWDEGAEADDDYDDDDDFLFGEAEEEEEDEEDEKEMEKQVDEEEEEEEEKTLMEQDDAVASKGGSSKLSRDHSGTATATEEKEEPIDPFLAECQASYGNRHFLTEDEKALPPILYSFPGSGNTWTRVLIDFGTGIYSGTIFGRPKATRTNSTSKLPGQGQCHQRVSVIKAHPNHFSPQQLFNISPTSGMTARCNRIGKITSFKRFILLTRNPFDAIWSEYRRTKKSHVILRKDFNATEFSRLVLNRYSVQYKDMIMFFREIRRTLPTEDIFTLQYENMLDQDLRLGILSRMIDFIGLNKKESPQDLRRRLQCALLLAEHVGGGRRGNKVVGQLDETEIIKTKDVYVPEVACRMWAIFGAEATVLGYTLPDGITEEECQKFEAEA